MFPEKKKKKCSWSCSLVQDTYGKEEEMQNLQTRKTVSISLIQTMLSLMFSLLAVQKFLHPWQVEKNSCGGSNKILAASMKKMRVADLLKNACGRCPPLSLRVTIVEIFNFLRSCVWVDAIYQFYVILTKTVCVRVHSVCVCAKNGWFNFLFCIYNRKGRKFNYTKWKSAK